MGAAGGLANAAGARQAAEAPVARRAAAACRAKRDEYATLREGLPHRERTWLLCDAAHVEAHAANAAARDREKRPCGS
jgi:hypothetical protein